MLNEVRSGPRARPRPRVAAADRADRGVGAARASPSCGTTVEEHRAYLERDGRLEERRRRNLAGEVFAVASARREGAPRAGGRATTPSCGGCSTRCSARELDPLTRRARDHGEGVQDWRRRRRPRSLTSSAARARLAGVARVDAGLRLGDALAAGRPRGPAEGREPAADRVVQDPRRVQPDRAASTRPSAPPASSPRAPATTARRSRGPRARPASRATIFMPQDAPMAKVEAARGYGAECRAGRRALRRGARGRARVRRGDGRDVRARRSRTSG